METYKSLAIATVQQATAVRRPCCECEVGAMQKILVIDDNVVVRNTIAQILESDGYEVLSAENGRRGLTVFRHEHPDLVVTDIIMPEKEGIETIRDIRDCSPNAKIIAISGGGRIGNTDFLKIARQLGASEVVAKPLDPDHFLEIVRSCLAAA
jgi:CheY-like chemotaxis protein